MRCLRELHDHGHLVQFLEALALGLQHVQRSHVGCAASVVGQQFDGGLAALGLLRLFAVGQRGDVIRQGGALQHLFGLGFGAVGHRQRFAKLQHPRHADANDRGVRRRSFQDRALRVHRQIELVPEPHAVDICGHQASADDGARNSRGIVAGNATKLQRWRGHSHHGLEHRVCQQDLEQFVVLGDAVGPRITAAVEVEVLVLDLQVPA